MYNYLFNDIDIDDINNNNNDNDNKPIIVHIDEPNSRTSTFHSKKTYKTIIKNNNFPFTFSSVVTSFIPQTRNNDLITTFNGFLTTGRYDVISLDVQHFLPKGYVVKNVDWVIAAMLHNNHHDHDNDDNDGYHAPITNNNNNGCMFLLVLSFTIIIYLVITCVMCVLFLFIFYYASDNNSSSNQQCVLPIA